MSDCSKMLFTMKYTFLKSSDSMTSSRHTSMADRLFILDYGGGNTRSLTNSIKRLGYEFEWVKEPKDLANAQVRDI